MTNLSDQQNKTHKRAVNLATIHARVEQVLVEVLIDVEAQKIHKALNRKSMVLYATKELKLPEPTALMLINVARKAKEVPALRNAIANERLTPSKASRIVAHINIKNAVEVIEFAATHNYRETDYEMARRNPKAAAKDRVKPLAEDVFEVTMTLTKSGVENLQRAQSLMAQKGKPTDLGTTVEEALTHYLNSQDPVRKAKRANVKKVCVHRINVKEDHRKGEARKGTNERTPIPASVKYIVNLRDNGRCTHPDPEGQRCNADRYVHFHHIIPLEIGGTHDPENLTTLCSFHHDMVHQLNFGIDGAVNWLR